MTIITTEYLTFENCSAEVQAKILEKIRYSDIEHLEWYEDTIGDITCALELASFNDIEVNFSGFGSQGGGAQFTGYYIFEGKKLNKVKKEYSYWPELINFVRKLENITKNIRMFILRLIMMKMVIHYKSSN